MSEAAEALRIRYLREAVETATPAERLLMIVDRLCVDLDRAAAALAKRDWFEANQRLVHAQEILLVLHDTLDPAQWAAGEQLKALYRFWHDELVAVNLQKDAERLAPVRAMVQQLAEAWRAAAAQLAQATPVGP
ncbi:flagellar export chaperone FliS [Aciditerrimonas ferrireducens]|jgi:flagellar protein FliS|uniref:flagellar export chaperone FliS n=1 Tax=Aciditerrimonas ferrireducens TaxID=667306 RepID=UPI0020037CFE|nr:flagellar export chaperone FliS [Aciditerrimonas ferrireducens]MCK4176515.1 flagellar protein FliS [Aciditerrimonas ferrireducens]